MQSTSVETTVSNESSAKGSSSAGARTVPTGASPGKREASIRAAIPAAGSARTSSSIDLG